ncbi:MAG TPA: hypothetical protein VN577_14245 [Terriglobales bacterium]|nr:hypothetical protein [Terriglobales bacterium]
MARYQIVCATRAAKTEDPQRHITHVGLGDQDGWSRVLMVEEVIMQLKKDDGDRYFLKGRDGWEAEVTLGKCPFCVEAHNFLASKPDLMAKDKLMTLGGCGD